MNNGQSRVFQGAQTRNINTAEQMYGQPQQPGQQQPQQLQQNALAALMQFSSKVTQQMNQPNSGASLYTTSNRNSTYSHLLSMDDNMAEEQIKAEAIANASQVGQYAWQVCARRVSNNPYYKIHMGARERFKCPKRSLPQDPTLTSFIAEIDANNTLYQLILANVSIMFAADMAREIIAGNEAVRTDRKVTDDIYYRCTIDAINMQFYHYLSTHPEGSQIFHRASPVVREVLAANENGIYNLCLDRFTFVGGQCPWRNGAIAELTQRASMPSTLLEMGSPLDMGFGGNYYEKQAAAGGIMTGTQQFDQNNGLEEMNAWIRQRAQQYNAEQRTNQIHTDQPCIQSTYGAAPIVLTDIELMTRENRHRYNLEDWATRIPNTEWYVVKAKHMDILCRYMTMDDGIPYRSRDTRVVGTVPVYRFNWMEGTFNFKLVKHNLKDFDLMSALVSNPEKLLPYMFDENGVQKSSWDPVVMETNKFMAADGIILPVGEMKELEKEPQVLIGNKPMKANLGNEALVNRIDVLTQTYDPKKQLDAFVVPTVITREWQMEPHVNMERFYKQFNVMVQGNTEGRRETMEVIRAIRTAYNSCESEEFSAFVKPYITNLVNRYLVEVAGFAETFKESKESTVGQLFQHSTDIFEDLEDWAQWLSNNDMPTLRAWNDYQSNTFMRMGIETLMSPEQVQAEYKEKYGKDEDPVIVAAMLKSGEKAVIISRNSIFFNIRNMPAPHNTEMFTVQKSVNPELFAIVATAIKVAGKHFDDAEPQLLAKFETDTGNKVYVITRSYLDPQNVFNVRPMDSGQSYAHCLPIN